MWRPEMTRRTVTDLFFPEVLDVLILSDAQREEYLGYWRGAAAEEFGLRVEVAVEDTDLLIHGLLQARAEHGGFANLTLIGTTPGVVFISKKGKRLDQLRTEN
jgi:hypothetical protein